jgi:hypothetical protein
MLLMNTNFRIVGIFAVLGLCLAGAAAAGEPFDPMPLFLAEKDAYGGGPFTFAVIGECKNECSSGGLEITNYIDEQYPDIAFAVTMGDMLHYQGSSSEWGDLADNIGWFMDSYATFPVLGDQERDGRSESRYYEFYGLPQAFRADNATWSLGNAVFLMLSYYDPPNFDGGENGRYTSPQASVYDLENGQLTTVQQVLEQATAAGQSIFTFSHAQYQDPSGADGHKYYCCYDGETRDLFEANNIKVHFQSDNPGFTTTEDSGIWYIRSSGAYGFDPAFFALVTVDVDSITVEFPETDGGSKGSPINIGNTPPDSFWLDVEKTGPGSGTVTSSPAGIDCGSDCSELFEAGSTVSLQATADSGSVFSGWGGHSDCTDGVVSMTQSRTCSANFDFDGTAYQLLVSITGSGLGSVTSTPGGIDCGSDCQQFYAEGTTVQLTPHPSFGSWFAGWSGDSDCADGTVILSEDLSCVGSFETDTDSCPDGVVRIEGWSTDPDTEYSMSFALPGIETYTDRSYTITSLSSELQNLTLIQTANDDKEVQVSEHLMVTLCVDATLFVAYDRRADSLPIWLSSPGWTMSAEELSSDDGGASPMLVYQRNFLAGSVILGGNIEGGPTGVDSNYLVVVRPRYLFSDGFESGDRSGWD